MLLKDLLQIPALRNARIAAGAEGLNRSVNTVNMMDAPDIIHFLKANELLLTTAYAMKDHPETLDTLVAQMAEAGCAGLAIKTKRFLEEIPESVILKANELQFPLLELSLDYSLGEVLNGALSSILQNKTNELSYALDTHHTFFNLILNGEGLIEIVDKLSQLIACPIVILGSKLELINLSTTLRPNIQLLNKWIADYASNKQTLNGGLYKVHGGTAADGTKHVRLQPIPTPQRPGYILAFTDEEEIRTHHALALEQAANVLGFELLKAQAVKDRARRFKIEFFTELVQGEITSEQEIIHRGKQHGLFPAESMICVVCGRDSDEHAAESEQDQIAIERKARETDHLYHVLTKEFARFGAPFVLFTLKDKLIALLSAKDLLGSSPEGKLRTSQQLQAISERMAASEDIGLSYGIGSPINKLVDIPVAYKQAMDAYRLGRSHNKQRFVQYYHTKEFEDLLRLIPVDDLQEFLQETFEAWNGIDEGEQREWRRTLRVFYDNHCHIGETAKGLYIHRNTVLYRLNRIEQLTGVQVRNPADSLRMRIALMIKELVS
ncbi:PucR family transcriptional regulator [Paenibacillus soyae]|uniref:PucR family transcriptional regulator ligand-binding domain-containing protein n=1 Tax=Paenibacillus soyae TaxID=2969249 RepID=A0A9X2MTB5_9BACL|nr:PucR family transcriptional regulator [Paenibacillus soyae]MCR2805503.1 PucR family transcriptional regulator ligand-binding domain-containing protein [Paenibacillus soyae]